MRFELTIDCGPFADAPREVARTFLLSALDGLGDEDFGPDADALVFVGEHDVPVGCATFVDTPEEAIRFHQVIAQHGPPPAPPSPLHLLEGGAE